MAEALDNLVKFRLVDETRKEAIERAIRIIHDSGQHGNRTAYTAAIIEALGSGNGEIAGAVADVQVGVDEKQPHGCGLM